MRLASCCQLASLDIDDQLKDVGQQAGTRYLYYPDHLVRLPGPPMTLDNIISTARSLYEEPLWDGLLPSVFNYFMKSGPQPPTPERRAAMDKDESVGHFLERLCGDDRLVKNVVSAMMHGIHGGDVYKLSAKHTLFNKLWYQTTGGGDKTKTWMPYKELSLLCDIMDGPNRAKVCELGWKGENSNMLAFDDGMLTLVHALEQDLQSQKQVKIKTQTPVTSLAPVDGGKVRVSSTGAPIFADGTCVYSLTKLMPHLAGIQVAEGDNFRAIRQGYFHNHGKAVIQTCSARGVFVSLRRDARCDHTGCQFVVPRKRIAEGQPRLRVPGPSWNSKQRCEPFRRHLRLGGTGE